MFMQCVGGGSVRGGSVKSEGRKCEGGSVKSEGRRCEWGSTCHLVVGNLSIFDR